MRVFSFFVVLTAVLPGCKKLVSVNDPLTTITTKQVFATDAQANAALAGVYTVMINGNNGMSNDAMSSFSSGFSTVAAGLSSDELIALTSAGSTYYRFNTNTLIADKDPAAVLWTSAYAVIYGANSVIEGIAQSSSAQLRDSTRRQLTGEAKLVRAYCLFYLTNFFGDVPLVLTVDFNKTKDVARTSQAKVYEQIVADLKDAEGLLQEKYVAAGGERVRPNKWAATALLARVYLFTGDHANAALSSAAVIGHTAQYGLVTDLRQVFGVASQEAIWQLQQNTNVGLVGNATPEGALFLPNPLRTGRPQYFLSDQLLAAFEDGDQRRVSWVDSTNNSQYGPVGLYRTPAKYQTGAYNAVAGGLATEYYMVLRLAEMYLIHAEALAHGAPGGSAGAVGDLNVIRHRAGLADLDAGLTGDALLAAVAHERQTELFAEWGHRWFDLKRTGKAGAVLSQIVLKQPWAGDYQLLYPVPLAEIKADYHLGQNIGY